MCEDHHSKKFITQNKGGPPSNVCTNCEGRAQCCTRIVCAIFFFVFLTSIGIFILMAFIGEPRYTPTKIDDES